LSRYEGRSTKAKENNLTGADLTGANLTNAVLHYSNFTNAILTGVNWKGVRIFGADFINVNLRAVDFSAENGPVWFNESVFNNVDLSNSILKNQRFASCHFNNVKLINSDCRGAIFGPTIKKYENVDFSGADLSGAEFRDYGNSKVDLSGCKFDGAKLEGVKGM